MQNTINNQSRPVARGGGVGGRGGGGGGGGGRGVSGKPRVPK